MCPKGVKKMRDKNMILRELEELPDALSDEVLDFIRFLKTKLARGALETALLSEAALSRDWLRPEEEEAWRDL